MENKLQFMTPDRTLVTTNEKNLHALLAVAPHMVQATDDVWLPKCDIQQYETGNRKPRAYKYII